MTRTKNVFHLTLLFALAGVPACATDVSTLDKQDEEDAPVDGKADGWNLTEHGDLVFDELADDEPGTTLAQDGAVLSRRQPAHAWVLELDDEADIGLMTADGEDGHLASGRSTVDTVMYLYRQQANGNWGRYLERNDDIIDNNVNSAIDRHLEAGTYRVIVKGLSRSTTGEFRISGSCNGPGCVHIDDDGEVDICGLQVADAVDGGSLAPGRVTEIHANSRPSAARQAMIVEAVQQHIDQVVELEDWRDALSFVDADSMTITEETNTLTDEKLVKVTFTLGDIEYGALFYAETGNVFSWIEDGEIVCP